MAAARPQSALAGGLDAVLEYYIDSLRGAESELIGLRNQLAFNSKLNIRPTYDTIARRLLTGNLGKLKNSLIRIDQVICPISQLKKLCLSSKTGPAYDVLLSLRLLVDGVAIGQRGDPVITAAGLAANVEEVLDKMNTYLEVLADGLEAAGFFAALDPCANRFGYFIPGLFALAFFILALSALKFRSFKRL